MQLHSCTGLEPVELQALAMRNCVLSAQSCSHFNFYYMYQ